MTKSNKKPPMSNRLKNALRVLRGKQSKNPGPVLLEIQYLLHRDVTTLRAKPEITKAVDRDDRRIVERIVKSFRLPSEDASQPADIWDRIYNDFQRPTVELLRTGDIQAVQALLKDPRAANLFIGFDGIFPGVVHLDPESVEQVMGAALVAHDHAICVAEVTGAVRYENPQAGPLAAKYAGQPTDDFIDALEKLTGSTLTFPNPYPGEVGVVTSRGIISPRALHAIYQAWRIRELVKDIAHPRILEIGGGMGRTAYYARSLGLHDYAIVDLPLAAVAQALFLMPTLGEDRVSMHGEEAGEMAETIKLHRPETFFNSDQSYDLIVNVDSMTEIGIDAALAYWEKIKRSTSRYLSINHEINPFTMAQIAREHPAGVIKYQRYPYGPRRGYVEEYFEFDAGG
ncbi:MAG: hypothetical protein GC184_14375 [Rhizobiales bacterium]|nr:hypothetical protein [Hyphomicrobiales bacterium]